MILVFIWHLQQGWHWAIIVTGHSNHKAALAAVPLQQHRVPQALQPER